MLSNDNSVIGCIALMQKFINRRDDDSHSDCDVMLNTMGCQRFVRYEISEKMINYFK